MILATQIGIKLSVKLKRMIERELDLDSNSVMYLG